MRSAFVDKYELLLASNSQCFLNTADIFFHQKIHPIAICSRCGCVASIKWRTLVKDMLRPVGAKIVWGIEAVGCTSALVGLAVHRDLHC